MSRGISLVFCSFEIEKYLYHKKEHPFPSWNHYSYVYIWQFIKKLLLLSKFPSCFRCCISKSFGNRAFFTLTSLFIGITNLYTELSWNLSCSGAISYWSYKEFPIWPVGRFMGFCQGDKIHIGIHICSQETLSYLTRWLSTVHPYHSDPS